MVVLVLLDCGIVQSKPSFTLFFQELLFSCLVYCLFSAEQALAHPYLQPLHDITNEPEYTTPFKFDIGQQPLTKEEVRELIYSEALDFNPEYQQE